MSAAALLLVAALPGGGKMPQTFVGSYVDYTSSCRVLPQNTLVISGKDLLMLGKQYRLIMVEEADANNIHAFVQETGGAPEHVRELHLFRDPAYNGNIVVTDDLALAIAAAEQAPPPADIGVLGAFERCPNPKLENSPAHAQN